jgi:hypothetical protein
MIDERDIRDIKRRLNAAPSSHGGAGAVSALVAGLSGAVVGAAITAVLMGVLR